MIFAERYPELVFLTQTMPFESKEFEDTYVLPNQHTLQKLEVLYVYGFGSGKVIEDLRPWLHEKRERDLVIIEDEIEAIHSFIHEVEDPQIHIRFILDRDRLEDFCEECAYSFPCNRVALIGNKDIIPESLELLLLRKTTIYEALSKETLYYHELFKNLYPNFLQLHKAYIGNALQGKFENVPAVICGAGPSLEQSLHELEKLKNKALLFAGGSTITALSKKGIHPHIALALDPNPDEYERLIPSLNFEGPLFYGNRLRSDVSNILNGPRVYLRTRTGGNAEAFLEDELGIETVPLEHGNHSEALSVTTTAIALAKHLGCNPIYLCGVDLAYTSMKRYAPGVVEDERLDLHQLRSETRASETMVEKTSFYGKKVLTLVKWIMESNWISHFAKQNQKIQFFAVSSEGLGFEDVSQGKLNSLLERNDMDLEGKVHALLEENKFTCTLQEIKQVTNQLKESLQRSLRHCDLMIKELEKCDNITEEPILFSVEKMDLENEKAYQILFAGMEESLSFHYRRIYRNGEFLPLTLSIWEHMRKVMQDYVNTLSKE